MFVEDQGGALVLSVTGAKLVDYLLGIARERGVDVSETMRLLIEVQAAAAIRQAERQLDPRNEP